MSNLGGHLRLSVFTQTCQFHGLSSMQLVRAELEMQFTCSMLVEGVISGFPVCLCQSSYWDRARCGLFPGMVMGDYKITVYVQL